MEARIPGTYGVAGCVVVVHVLSAGWLIAHGFGVAHSLVFPRTAGMRFEVGGQLSSAVEGGESWRLATSVLLHADALHLLVNALALVSLGRILEPWIGGRRLWAWFVAGGLAGSVASQWAGVAQSDGASGGAFALLGAATVLGFRWRRELPPDDARLLGPVLAGFVVVNLLVSWLVPAIDAAAHLGGFAVGLLVPWIPDRWGWALVESVLLGGFVGACAYGWFTSLT